MLYGAGSEEGVEVMISDDLKTWKRVANAKYKVALHKDNSYGEKWFWAPEVYFINNKFYMYYSAEEHICVAISDSPLGPFKQIEQRPMLEEKAIDSSLFIDDDGTPYLFFVKFNKGNEIWVGELESDLMTLKKETLRLCIQTSQNWEKIQGKVTEGAFVIKHKGIYHMAYSANDYQSPNYGIGGASANTIMGEWTKYSDNPLLQKPKNLVGVGHNSIFKDKKGNLKIVFHAHKSKTEIHPRNMYITSAKFEKAEDNFKLVIDPNYETPLLQIK